MKPGTKIETMCYVHIGRVYVRPFTIGEVLEPDDADVDADNTHRCRFMIAMDFGPATTEVIGPVFNIHIREISVPETK